MLQCTSETEDEYAELLGVPRIIVFKEHRSYSKADFEKNRDRCSRFSVIQGTPVMGNLALNTV